MTENQRRNWYKLCSEPLDKIEHYEEALAEGFAGWCIHHRREIQPDGTIVSMQELKDHKLYYGRPANELIFMRNGEHMTLHHKGRTFSEEHRQKISSSQKGRSPWITGKHHSADTRQKIAEARKGKQLWNNGIEMKMSRECPGEGWKRGRLKASRTSL